MTQSDWSIRANRGAQAVVPVYQDQADGLYKDVGSTTPLPVGVLDSAGASLVQSSIPGFTDPGLTVRVVPWLYLYRRRERHLCG